MQLTYFDLATIAILLIFAIRGMLRGFIAEVSGLLGLAAGLVLARTFFFQVSDLLKGFIADNAAPAVAFVALLLTGMLLVGLIARILQRALDFVFANWLDSLGGVVVGLAKGAILCGLLAYVALMIIPHFQEIKDSVTIPYLMGWVRKFVSALNINIPLP